jgi:hypothetical protein
MPVPNAHRPSALAFVFLFKIIMLKKYSPPFEERYSAEIKKQNVTTKAPPNSLRKLRNNLIKILEIKR